MGKEKYLRLRLINRDLLLLAFHFYPWAKNKGKEKGKGTEGEGKGKEEIIDSFIVLFVYVDK